MCLTSQFYYKYADPVVPHRVRQQRHAVTRYNRNCITQ